MVILRSSNLPYVSSHVIKRYKWQEFLSIPTNRIKPIVHNIRNKESDRQILWSWELHFQGYFNGKKIFPGIPYVITQDPKSKIKTLWKEFLY